MVFVAALAGIPVAGLPSAAQTRAGRRGPAISVRAADLLELESRCGAPDPGEETYRLVRERAGAGGRLADREPLAFEENRHFIYALLDLSRGRRGEGDDWSRPPQAPRRLRRFFLLKPATFVIEDLTAAAGGRPARWILRSTAEPRVEGRRIRVTEGAGEILAETLLPADASLTVRAPSGGARGRPGHRVVVAAPAASGRVRFLHVFQAGGAAGKTALPRSTLAQEERRLILTVSVGERTFRLILPHESAEAGEIGITDAEGRTVLPQRLLPSGVMPHGPEGARLLERWDSPYRRDRMPGWDVGRPCRYLVEAVEDGTLKPGRAIVLGCGTGTNAIYLAGRGFEVTGVDVAPSALDHAREKARKAGVKVRWIVADVLALPELKPFDVIFDRGCYHHVRQYDAVGYVEAVRRLSRPGTRMLLLAGSDKRSGGGGPPRVKEEEIRGDFSALFAIEWIREIRFESRNPNSMGPPARSVLMRRKGD